MDLQITRSESPGSSALPEEYWNHHLTVQRAVEVVFQYSDSSRHMDPGVPEWVSRVMIQGPDPWIDMELGPGDLGW